METDIYYVLFTINIYVKELDSLKTYCKCTYNKSKFDFKNEFCASLK